MKVKIEAFFHGKTFSLQADKNPKAKPVWAYLSELDPNTKVALYWS